MRWHLLLACLLVPGCISPDTADTVGTTTAAPAPSSGTAAPEGQPPHPGPPTVDPGLPPTGTLEMEGAAGSFGAVLARFAAPTQQVQWSARLEVDVGGGAGPGHLFLFQPNLMAQGDDGTTPFHAVQILPLEPGQAASFAIARNVTSMTSIPSVGLFTAIAADRPWQARLAWWTDPAAATLGPHETVQGDGVRIFEADRTLPAEPGHAASFWLAQEVPAGWHHLEFVRDGLNLDPAPADATLRAVDYRLRFPGGFTWEGPGLAYGYSASLPDPVGHHWASHQAKSNRYAGTFADDAGTVQAEATPAGSDPHVRLLLVHLPPVLERFGLDPGAGEYSGF